MDYTVCDHITLTFSSVPFLRNGRSILRIVCSVPFLRKGQTVKLSYGSSVSFRSLSTQESNRPTDRPFRLSIVL